MFNKRILIMTFLLTFLFLSGCILVPTSPVIDNQAPVIISQPVTTVELGESYIYDVNATDADGDDISYSLAISPIGMTINHITGIINWIPTSSQIGHHLVIVEIFDMSLTATQTFQIEVSKPPEPDPIPEPDPEPIPIPDPIPLPKYYTIVAVAGPGGSINPSGYISVVEGTDKLFIIIPDSLEIKIKDISVDGESVDIVNFYTFVNVTENHTIYITFKLINKK